MNPQRRRLEAITENSSSTTARRSIEMQFQDAPAVNIHGMRYCGSIEPENADANCNGFWICYCLPGDVIPIADLPNEIGDLGNPDSHPYIWGVGCFTASNQAPYHFEFAPSTSRTCQKGARVLSYIVCEGISAGAVRTNQLITGFTTT